MMSPINYKKYPPGWRSEIVPRILNRAGNCCEICHIKNGSKAYSIEVRIQGLGGISWRWIWLTQWTDVIRMREYTKTMKEIKIVLTVAHLDHDEGNLNIEDNRLMAMCQYCHLLYDREEKAKRGRFKKQQLRLMKL